MEQINQSAGLPGVVSALTSSKTKMGSSTQLLPLTAGTTAREKKRSGERPLDSGSPALAPISSGIPLSDVSRIMYHLEKFSLRASQVLSVIYSMGQFKALAQCVVGVPHASKDFWNIHSTEMVDDLVKGAVPSFSVDGDTAPSTVSKPMAAKDRHIRKVLKMDGEDGETITEDEGIDVDTVSRTSTPEDAKQRGEVTAVTQESTVGDEGAMEGASSGRKKSEGTRREQVVQPSKRQGGPSQAASTFGDKTPDYVQFGEEDGSAKCRRYLVLVSEGNVSALVQLRLKEMAVCLRKCKPAQGATAASNNIPTTSTSLLVFDTHSNSQEVFEAIYVGVTAIISTLEKELVAYMRHLLNQKMPALLSLGHIEKFTSIRQRSEVKLVFHECTLLSVKTYVTELEELMDHYEQHKVRYCIPVHVCGVGGG